LRERLNSEAVRILTARFLIDCTRHSKAKEANTVCTFRIIQRGIDFNAVQAVVDFFIPKSLRLTIIKCELLHAANFLLVDEIKQFCFGSLESVLNEKTCFVVADAFHRYADARLYHKAISYLSKNLINIVQSADCQQLAANKFTNYLFECK